MQCVAEVSGLMVYPVKSASGIVLQTARCTREGLQHVGEPELRDRRWVVVLMTEMTGKIIPVTSRAYPPLVLVRPGVKGKVLTLDAPGMTQLSVAIDNSPPEPGKVYSIRMEDERVEGVDCGDEAAQWFSKYLGKPRMRLLHSAPTVSRRKLHVREIEGMRHSTATPDDQVAFPDLCPFLVLGQPSVEHLNSRLATPVTTRNFRPNIITSNCEAHAEDTWDEVHIGSVRLRGTWPCPRCVFTTIDPDTAIKNPDKQPLETLKKYRMHPDHPELTSPLFGRYFLTENESTINVGDKVYATMKPAGSGL